MVWTLDGAGDKLGEERAEEKENSRAVLDGCSFLEYIDDVSEKLETMERDSRRQWGTDMYEGQSQ